MSGKKTVNEQVLSQQLGQLSPFRRNQNDQQRFTGMDFDFIPEYLLTTNESFDKKISSVMPSTMNLEELRKIAIIMHRIISMEIVHHLWIVYEQSTMGTLPLPTILLTTTLLTHEIDRKIIPNRVQSLLKQQSETLLSSTDDHDRYSLFIDHCLRDLNLRKNQYQQELKTKADHLHGYTRSIEHVIEKFIQQNLECFRLETNQEIASIQYDYTEQILKRIFHAQNATQSEIELMERICKLQNNQEKSKHEVDFLKEKISIYIPLHPFEREPIIGQSSLINRVSDPSIRQQLYQQYKNVAEEARNTMMNLYLESAEEQKKQCQLQYDTTLKEIQDTHTTLPSNQKLTKQMWDLIEQLSVNISERIECLYKFKIQLFLLQSNIH